MSFHSDLSNTDIHALTANTYADIAARDADTAFQITTNIDKEVRVDSPGQYFRLFGVSPTVWLEMSSIGADEFIELLDTPASYTGQAGKVAQVNAGATALEFGQALRTTDSPTFADLVLTGNLTVQGTTTTLDTTTLLVEDKNIELGVVTTPTDVTADGGGITLRGDTDKTILWIDATNSWTFNQDLEITGQIKITGGGPAVGKVLTSDVDGLANWTLPAGGGWTDAGVNVFLTNINDKVGIGEAGPNTKLHVADGGTAGAVTPFAGTIATFESPGDGYISILTPNANKRGVLFGEPSSNIAGGIIFNNGGNGGFDFQIGGVTKTAFTSAGHLHLLTDTDQKHNVKIKTADNTKDSGMAWENSGGNFSQTIFRTDVGSNRSDLVFAIGSNADIDLLTNSFKIHGSAANEGRLEVLGELQISSGSPGLNKILTSDASGIATWQNPLATGWTDDGTVVRLTTSTDDVVIGANTGFGAPLELVGDTPGTVGGFASGAFQVRSPSASVNANAVITGHNSFGGNKQLWYVGSSSSSNDNITFLNRQNAELQLGTNSTTRMTIASGGDVTFTGNIITAGFIDFGVISSVPDVEGRVYYDTEDKALNLKTDIAGSTQSLGQEFWVRVINKTGSSIADGKVVYINGFDVTSGRPTIALAKADVIGTSDPIGLATSTMANNAEGPVTAMGFLNDLNTSAFSNGDPIFLSETTAGEFTATKPTLVVPLGFVTKADATTGQVFTTISRATTDSPIFALLSSNVDQEPSVTTPVVITYNTQDDIKGITHSTSTNPGEITIDIAGTYFVMSQPQVGKDTGGTKIDFDMFLQVDTGAGFADEANSNIKLTIKDADITDVIVSGMTKQLNVGDKIRMMQRISNSGVGMGLKNTDPVVGPPTVPRTPSIIFTMFRVGGI